MATWTNESLKQLIAGASQSTRELNPMVTGLPAAKPQSRPVPSLARDSANEGRSPRRCHICITARRVRLQDPDNAIVKWIIDGLRYNGIIADDTTDHITLEVRQEKVSQKCKQGTEIKISEI